MIDGMHAPPLIYNVLYGGTATLTDMWVWWGESTSVASGITLIHTLGIYDDFGEPVPGSIQLENVQTNIEYAAIDTSVPGDSVILIDSMLGQTAWSPFPNVGPGFNYDLSPPSLLAFTQPPFAPIVPPDDQTPPVFAIPTASIQFVPGDRAIVRASPVVADLYDLTTRPLRYWVQNGEDSRSTIVSGLHDWVHTQDLFVGEADFAHPQSTPGPMAKLQVGLSTFQFPRTPQFRMLSTLLDTNAVFDLSNQG